MIPSPIAPPEDDVLQPMHDLSTLMRDAKSLAAPYDAQIRALEIARADALAGLTFQIDTLKALIRPLLVAAGHTVKVDGLIAQVIHKQTWDTERLLQMAEEIPAILQCRMETTYVAFR